MSEKKKMSRIFTADCARDGDNGWLVEESYDDLAAAIERASGAGSTFLECIMAGTSAGRAAFQLSNITAIIEVFE